MSVRNQIETDLTSAMKSQSVEQTSLLRMLKSALKNAEIATGKELSDTEVLSVLEKQVKQRLDAAQMYEKGARADLAAKEKSEAEAIQQYLPAKMSEVELTALVDAKIQELSASQMSDMGKVIAAVLAEAKGAADGGTVSGIVKQRLS